MIDVEDMSRAIAWAITRKDNGGQFLAVNTEVTQVTIRLLNWRML